MNPAPADAVSNPGLPMTAPLHYSSTVVLYTAVDPIEVIVDGAPPGPNGRLFKIPTGKPVKVPHEAGRFIIEHLGYTGVVRVREEEQKDKDGNVIGITYDVESAKIESLEKTKQMDEVRWHQFISDMVEDFVKKNKPVPPPPEAINRIIKRRGYRMQDFGVKPIGFKDPVDEMNAARDAENKELKDQVADLNSKLNLLLKQQAMKEGAGNDDGKDANVQSVPTTDRSGGRQSSGTGNRGGGRARSDK